MDKEEQKKFGAHQLCLAIINHIIDQQELLFDEIAEDIKYCYGAFKDTRVRKWRILIQNVFTMYDEEW